MNVRIYKLDRSCELNMWLCPKALAVRMDAGWTLKGSWPAPKENPRLTCDDRATGCCNNGIDTTVATA